MSNLLLSKKKMSNLHNTLTLLLFSIESIASLAISIASNICLPSTKAFWNLETTLLTTFLSMFVNTLTNSLLRPFTKLIGLKSIRSHAPSPPFLGIKTKKVALMLFTNLPWLWKSLKKSHRLFLHKTQLNFQKAIKKPSRALSPFRSERVTPCSPQMAPLALQLPTHLTCQNSYP